MTNEGPGRTVDPLESCLWGSTRPVHSTAWGSRTQKGSEKHREVFFALWGCELPRNVFYPQAALTVILAQRCHMNLLCFSALLAFPSRSETWKSSLWMRMAHWVRRVSSWGFVSHSPIKCKVGHLQMSGKKWPPQEAKLCSSVTWQQLEGMGISFVYWGSECVQGEIMFMLSLRTEWIPSKVKRHSARSGHTV